MALLGTAYQFIGCCLATKSEEVIMGVAVGYLQRVSYIPQIEQCFRLILPNSSCNPQTEQYERATLSGIDC